MNLTNDKIMQHHLEAYEEFQYLLQDCENPRKPVSRCPVAGPSRQTATSSQQCDQQNNRKPSQVPVNMWTVALLIPKKHSTWLWNGEIWEQRVQTISLARSNSERVEIPNCRSKTKCPGSARLHLGLRQCTENALSPAEPHEQERRHRCMELPVFCGLLTVCLILKLSLEWTHLKDLPFTCRTRSMHSLAVFTKA